MLKACLYANILSRYRENSPLLGRPSALSEPVKNYSFIYNYSFKLILYDSDFSDNGTKRT